MRTMSYLGNSRGDQARARVDACRRGVRSDAVHSSAGGPVPGRPARGAHVGVCRRPRTGLLL